jgi:hypothetical protein
VTIRERSPVLLAGGGEKDGLEIYENILFFNKMCPQERLFKKSLTRWGFSRV